MWNFVIDATHSTHIFNTVVHQYYIFNIFFSSSQRITFISFMIRTMIKHDATISYLTVGKLYSLTFIIKRQIKKSKRATLLWLVYFLNQWVNQQTTVQNTTLVSIPSTQFPVMCPLDPAQTFYFILSNVSLLGR